MDEQMLEGSLRRLRVRIGSLEQQIIDLKIEMTLVDIPSADPYFEPWRTLGYPQEWSR